MNSGYATDGSDGSNPNKRSRSDDGAAATSTTVRTKCSESKSGWERHPTPLEVGKAVADQHITLLHSGLHKLLAKHAYAVLEAYATYFGRNQSTRERITTKITSHSRAEARWLCSRRHMR